MWSAVAGSWAEYADDTDARHAPETAAMLAATAPVPGDHVLELAAGAGGLGLEVADLVAPGGRVVISDVAVEMTAAARARAGTREAVEVRTLDIESIAEPDSSYDVVLCRHGLQFAVDPSAASREIARVLRPGGRLAASVWGPAAANPWLSVVMEAVQSVLGRPVPPPGIPGPFALSQAGHLAGLLEAAGLARVAVSEISEPLTAADFDGWWTWTTRLAGPLTKILSSLDEQATTAIRERARASLADRVTEHGYHLPGLALVVSARRP
ncbi:class I SAM-dependent methyltransferase [Nocardioides cynanchi]|uniref:class I SAM-dependent methyltransferase n=1 Tax=Nocardioides cynanchi TaxID=2558918 RepID=UPI001EE23F33|nr:class I SAM-dependent methyltransferase [Nocardioides cynanchi]